MAGTEAFPQAVELYRQGDTARAAALCRDVLAGAADFAPALHLLGTIEFAAGRRDAGLALLERAVAAQPDYAEGLFTLGEMLVAAGRPQAARTHFECAAALRPSQAEPQAKLGGVLLQLGRAAEAEAAFRRALALRPDDAAVAADMAAALMAQGRLDDAIRYGRRAVALARDFAPGHVQLALALRARHELGTLGGAAAGTGDLGEAEEHLRTALRLQPGYEIAVTTLVAVLKRRNRLVEAAEICRQAIAAAPDFADAHAALADLLVAMGDTADGLAAAREARRLRPDDPQICRELILFLELADGIDDGEVVREARAWQQRFAAPLAPAARPARPAASGKPLRIGYIGGSSMRRTPFYNVMAPIIEGHDRRAVEVVCYSDLPESLEDEFTARFRAAAEWRRTEGLDDAAFAERVRADGIDVLVDSVQLFPGSRMLALARRPAPVQVAFPLNATCGGVSIDHVVADGFIVPPDAEPQFAENVLRVPIAHCYRPFEPAPPATASPPSLAGGAVTFGSFNWLSKIGPGVLAAWGRILGRVPGSRLVIKCGALGDAQLAERFRTRLGELGVAAQRIDIRRWTATYAEHMAVFNEIDLVLDSFAYNGVTTTCDALSMGVPVVTLVGRRALGRYGLALLKTVGFDDGIASTPDEYVEAACRLASDPTALAARRLALRAAFLASPICDGQRIAGSLEEAYRTAWARSGAGN